MINRLNSENKIEHNFFTLKLGTTNKQNPQVIYIEGRTFISPNEDKDSYEKDLRDLKIFLKKKIYQALVNSDYFWKEYILDFQIANSGVRLGKKSFLSFEVLLKQRGKNVLKLKEIKNNCQDTILEIINSFKDEIIRKGFCVTKTKNVIVENAVLLHS